MNIFILKLNKYNIIELNILQSCNFNGEIGIDYCRYLMYQN